MKIAVLGLGNIGSSLVKSFLQYEFVKNDELHLISKSDDDHEKLNKLYEGAKIDTYSDDLIIDSDILILSIKPQDFKALSKNINFQLKESTMILSIMAGIKIEEIQSVFKNHRKVVRAMPNSPISIGMGITGYTAAKDLGVSDLLQTERLLNCSGRTIYIEKEESLDSITALSGSGPAYFYYIVDSMVQAGKQMGFDENISKLLVKQTMLGAYHLINQSDGDLEKLSKEVASKGGTTEAALEVFKSENVGESIIEGILSAEKRSIELSKENL